MRTPPPPTPPRPPGGPPRPPGGPPRPPGGTPPPPRPPGGPPRPPGGSPPPPPPRGPTPPSRGPTPPGRGPTPPKAGPPPRPTVKPPAARPKPPRKLPAWLERARRLILQPAQELTVIAGEFTTAGPIFVKYVLVMAAIGPVASTVGGVVFGERGTIPLVPTVPTSAGDAVQAGVLQYVLNLVGVYVLALAVAAYGSTPYWLAGVVAVFPKLAPVGMLFGLYSIRLFALGLSSVMKVPRDKIAAATLLTSIAAALIALLVGAVLTQVFIS